MITSKKICNGSVSDPETHLRKQVLQARWKDVRRIAFVLTFTLLLFPLLYHSASRVQPLSQLPPLPPLLSLPQFSNVSAIEPLLITAKHDLINATKTIAGNGDLRKLRRILREASMEEKTVIVTLMNGAWAEPNSTFDVFLEGFHAGEGTERLLRHLLVVCLDEEAYTRCAVVHPRRCFLLKTDGVNFSGEKLFMVPDYLKMMWRRTEFLGSLLKLGYNFLFTDMDTIWLRDPFPRLYAEADFQVAGDFRHFNGNSSDVGNRGHGGFNFVVANRRTVKLYEYWYASRIRFPGKNEQVVLECIKGDQYMKEIGIKMKFIDPIYFGNFCQPNWDITKVCLMHGNCCSGKGNKVKDLRQVLEDWRNFSSSSFSSGKTEFRKPMNCWRRRRPHRI